MTMGWFFKAALFLALMVVPAVAQDARPDADGWVTLGRYTIPQGAVSARLAVKPNSGTVQCVAAGRDLR